MLATSRFCLLVQFLVLFSFAVSLPAVSQVHGVPASVTSLGFGGSDNPAPGPRASVTSLGPNGYAPGPFWASCCSNFFLPPGSLSFRSGRSQRTGHHRHHRDDLAYVPIEVPAYLPYGAAYSAEADEEDTADDDDAGGYNYARAYAPDPGPARRPGGAKGLGRRGPAATQDGDSQSKSAASEQPDDPVAPQPSTVLVFKDGRRSDVVNYAIVGDTLFDFAEGRTRKIPLTDLDLAATAKANDERGVEFRVPPVER